MAGSAFLTVLVGLLIPSTFIAASPQEFVDTSYFYHPLWYLLSSFCMAAGTFLVWLRVFYWLATPKGKMLFDRLVWVLSGVMLTNYMFFGTNLGIISSTLQYEKEMFFSQTERLLNIAVIFAIVILFYFVVRKWHKFATGILLSAVVALGAMSAINMIKINSSVNDISVNGTTDTITFEMSTEGQNVVVLVLDRAMGEFIPYILNEKPELKEQFDGFTYYSNTISFGTHTNFALPALSGGYDYTPVEMNIRDTEKLGTKHNESLQVMPVLFDENDYDVTVCDPSYANYQWISDTSIYDEYPDIQAYLTD